MIDANDAVVLPYRNILNSGVALHSLARNKPILAPRTGSLPELQQTVGGDWVHLFDGDISAEGLGKTSLPPLPHARRRVRISRLSTGTGSDPT